MSSALTSESSPPRVTVVVGTYNRGARIVPTLRAILAQTFTDFEVLVVGDGCTDDTAHHVGSLGDSRVRWIAREVNSGSQSGPNNEGIAGARGKFVAYCGHDDLWFPWHLESLVGCIERTGSDLVHDMMVMLQPPHLGAHLVFGSPARGVRYGEHFVPPSGWLHRRELAERIDGWRPADEIALAVDVDFLRRAEAAEARFDSEPRLGVVKWSSGNWRAYASESPFPQAEFLTRMLADARQAEHALLQEVAQSFAAKRTESGVWRATRNIAVAILAWKRAVAGWMCGCYGRDRWPVNVWLLRDHQRWRRRWARMRGLR